MHLLSCSELLDLADALEALSKTNLNKWEAEFVSSLIRSIASGKVEALTTKQQNVLNGLYFQRFVIKHAEALEKKHGITPRFQEAKKSR